MLWTFPDFIECVGRDLLHPVPLGCRGELRGELVPEGGSEGDKFDYLAKKKIPPAYRLAMDTILITVSAMSLLLCGISLHSMISPVWSSKYTKVEIRGSMAALRFDMSC